MTSYLLKRYDYGQLFPNDSDYPKSTSAALGELRARGIDVNRALVYNMIQNKKIRRPLKGARDFEWFPDTIDELAQYAYDKGYWSPVTYARQHFNIHPAQHIRALREAGDRHPGLYPDQFSRRIGPSKPGYGDYGIIEYAVPHSFEALEQRRRAG